MVDLISVNKAIIFVEDYIFFVAKLKIVNQSSRYVSFKVCSSDCSKFTIKQEYGFIPPRGHNEIIIVTTKMVTAFHEISDESFCVFALPIYDLCQLKRKMLRSLWRVHGTECFPYEASEFHRIPYVLPKSDTYFDDLSILHRLDHFRHLLYDSRNNMPKLFENEFDTVAFLSKWPLGMGVETGGGDMNNVLPNMISDWHTLAYNVNLKTKAIMENATMTLAMIIVGVITIWGTAWLCSSDVIGVCRDKAASSSENQVIMDLTKEEEEFVESIWSGVRSWWS